MIVYLNGLKSLVRAMERMHVTSQHIGFANELTVIYAVLASNFPVTFWILVGMVTLNSVKYCKSYINATLYVHSDNDCMAPKSSSSSSLVNGCNVLPIITLFEILKSARK